MLTCYCSNQKNQKNQKRKIKRKIKHVEFNSLKFYSNDKTYWNYEKTI